MELFPDGAFVRLRSRGRDGMYLHADEDGVGVSLSRERASLHVAWQVHRIVRGGVPFALLHGAAYGRYLSATLHPAPDGHAGRRVVQGTYDDQEQNTTVWFAVRISTRDAEVALQNHSRNGHGFLRANGKHCRWRNGVSIDDHLNRTTMKHWIVETIPLRTSAPLVPLATVDPVQPGGGRFIGLFPRRSRSEPEPDQKWAIRFVVADADGNVNEQDWGTFQFHGRSVFSLWNEAAHYSGSLYFFDKITVCARAGRYGRLTPLFTDLPRGQENMDIVALPAGSAAEAALQYPEVDAP
ncbi:hypothetical protein QOZ80_6BG0462330 [Eleusine coracana subsp. coracana]|nr:hypothetical protein QOZ80_6BG0462330 [Eleusine coracana subsp. coracana]